MDWSNKEEAREYHQKKYQKNKERILQQQKEYYKENRKKRIKLVRNYRKNHPKKSREINTNNWAKNKHKINTKRRLRYKIDEYYRIKQRAKDKLNAAVRQGKLIRPKECSRCGRFMRIEGHHEDYSKPLVVEWLCRTCHKLQHRVF